MTAVDRPDNGHDEREFIARQLRLWAISARVPESDDEARTMADELLAARPSADTEKLRRWITEAVSALDAATRISQRAFRTGQPEGLHTGNHDRLIREADALLAALDAR